jgi:hypothetical protein
MSLILDAGALLAVERGRRDVVALIKQEMLSGRAPVAHGGVVGQVWRGGAGRQARLATLVPGLDVRPLDVQLGQQSGALLGKTRGADVIDAALAILAGDGDVLLTSDPTDLALLVRAAGVHVDVVRVLSVPTPPPWGRPRMERPAQRRRSARGLVFARVRSGRPPPYRQLEDLVGVLQNGGPVGHDDRRAPPA